MFRLEQPFIIRPLIIDILQMQQYPDTKIQLHTCKSIIVNKAIQIISKFSAIIVKQRIDRRQYINVLIKKVPIQTEDFIFDR